ncbi:MAG: hypothetical protein N2484_02590 [Clostridia bacterium]|nr:hypothetical protein [Clostridia bacterium]
MRLENKIVFSVLSVLIIFILAACSKNVAFEVVPLDQVPEKVGRIYTDGISVSTGIAEMNGKTYAAIIPPKGTEIQIVSVGRSENVGIDVTYRIIKLEKDEETQGSKVVRFSNKFGAPVGFVKVE